MKTGAAVTNSQPVAETFEAELASIKEKGKELKGDSRDFYISIVQRLENNNQVLKDLREEHTNLRKLLGELVKEKSSRTHQSDLDGEIKRFMHKVNLLKKQIDNFKHQKQSAIDRQGELQLFLDNLQNNKVTVEDDSDRVRALKNKLDNSEIKISETNHLMKVMNQVQYLLERQKMRWNSILENHQKEIAQKQRDIADLTLIARDSKHSRSTATNEFIRTQKATADYKEKRDASLKSKYAQIHSNIHRPINDNEAQDDNKAKPQQSLNSQPSLIRNRNNRVQRDKREEKYRAISATLDDIREFFGTSEPEQINAFFEERKKTTESLRQQINQIQESIKILEKEASMVRSSIEEAEYTSSKGIGTNRLLTEGIKYRNDIQTKLNAARRDMGLLQSHKRSVENGIDHIGDVMNLIQRDENTFPENMKSNLQWVKSTITKIQNMLKSEESDFVSICDPAVLSQRHESTFEIQHVDSSHRVVKRTIDPLKRPAKENKGEVVSRVQNRQAIKMAAQKALAAKSQIPEAKKISK